ncbi:MAG: glycogen/starch synthase [Gammaproteobacteria bacterium]|nr:glycogen/starch synthase [Gammaproteobacteria bacterium]
MRQAVIATRQVLFIAAENGALPGGKVGGVGDVVRDLPRALHAEGWRVVVLTPSYGAFHRLPGATELPPIAVRFRGSEHDVRVFELVVESVTTVLFEHDLLVPTETGRVYHDDGPLRPYATDANKFAFFCAAAASWIDTLASLPDVVHLHDWHAAFYLLHREFSPDGERLRQIPTVFTIHNLTYQGQRPLRHNESSLEAWFPDMNYDARVLADPFADDCINPLAFAIRRADRINTVSPTYAQEIQCPSNPDTGFIGGEGLEKDLTRAAEQERLFGILNGCEYPASLGRRPGWQRLLMAGCETAEAWLRDDPGTAVHELALGRLNALPNRRPLHILTSVGRIVSQKMQLFFEPLADRRSALEHILDKLGRSGVLILLGSGESDYEERLERIAAKHSNFVFLRGYAEEFGSLLYHGGDLFLMPSSFEPCGISQMLAMRAGQPCVVHGVGGLHDTVESGATGFVFAGRTRAEQSAAFVDCVEQALKLRHDHPNRWQKIRNEAAAQRFDWASSARQYIGQLYEHDRN